MSKKRDKPVGTAGRLHTLRRFLNKMWGRKTAEPEYPGGYSCERLDAYLLFNEEETATKKHPTSVPGFADVEELAEYVENMRYDHVQIFLKRLADRLIDRSDSDFDAGRRQLAKTLEEAAEDINWASFAMEQAWHICKPHMVATGEGTTGGERDSKCTGHGDHTTQNETGGGPLNTSDN